MRHERTKDTSGSVESPETDANLEPDEVLLSAAIFVDEVEVNPQAVYRKNGQGDVDDLECFVKGMSKGAVGLNADANKSASSGKTPSNQTRGHDGLERCCCKVGLGKVSESMDEGLENGNTAKPSVDQIVSVKGDSQERNKRVVSSSQKEERNHVESGQDAGTVADLGGSNLKTLGIGDLDDTEDDIGGEVGSEEQKLESRGKSADVDSLAQLNLAVVSLAEDGGVQDMAFEGGQVWIGNGPVSLAVVVERRDFSSQLVDLVGEFPDDDGHGHGAADDEEVVGQFVVGDDAQGVKVGSLGVFLRTSCRSHFGLLVSE